MGGLGAQPPGKYSVTTPFRHSENEGNALFTISFLKNCVNIPCKVIKKLLYESSGHCFTLVKPSSHQVFALTRGARGNKRLTLETKKIKFER